MKDLITLQAIDTIGCYTYTGDLVAIPRSVFWFARISLWFELLSEVWV